MLMFLVGFLSGIVLMLVLLYCLLRFVFDGLFGETLMGFGHDNRQE